MEASSFLCIIAVLLLGTHVEGLHHDDYHHHQHHHHHLLKRLFVFGDSYVDTENIWKPLASCWKVPYGITFPGKPSGRFSDGRVVGITAGNTDIKRLFVFGDSFADTGNTQNTTLPYYSIRYPYGETFPGYPTGRWSDGKIMTDFVAAYLDLPSPIPYSKRNQTSVVSQRYGMNFAYGGTGVFDTFTGLPSMTEQINLFEQLINSGLYAQDLDSAMALVSYAGNDYSVYLERNNGSLEGIATFRQAVIQQLSANLQRIQNLGVKKVAVTNLQPTGCSPTVTYATSYSQCVALYNNASQQHNQLLKDAVDALNSSIVILDNYNGFLAVLQQENFGNRLKGCCMGVDITVWCGTVDGNGTRKYTLCPKPLSVFWWDNNHPTQAAWKAVVEYHRSRLDQLLGRPTPQASSKK